VGDTFCYDEEAVTGQADREKTASERLFGLLPAGQATEFRDLWDEFEEAGTPEAKFARSLDRLMPMLHNYYSGGKAWKEHGIKKAQVLRRNRVIEDGSEKLWTFALTLIDRAADKGYLAE
jgi:putative hydrolase of HD superfamily